jgi:streptogramin lyase
MRGLLFAGLCFPLFLSGCSITQTAAPAPEHGSAIMGTVHGGQNPITGAHVYLNAAEVGCKQGYHNSNPCNSTPLLNAASTGLSDSLGAYVLTDPNGSFSITGDYTCTPGSQVYLYASGGNPGLAPGTNNTAIGLIAALGFCPIAGTFPSGLYVVVNEVSTVAAAYALGGYAFDGTHISGGVTASGQTGIANAFLNTTNLVNLATGQALTKTPAGNAVVPRPEINTLANILSSCVVTTDGTSPTCQTLFADAGFLGDPSRGTSSPTDTATAAINIAHQPTTNVALLFALAPSGGPFQPAQTSAPADWTISLTFNGTKAGVSNPFSVAIDAEGDAWTTNTSCACISEVSSLGVPISPSGGYTLGGLNVPEFLAFDLVGNVWVTNSGGNAISAFSSTGVALSPAGGFTDPSLDTPVGVAIDASNNVWVPNYSSSTVSEFKNNDGLIIHYSWTGIPTEGGLAQPLGIALDSSSNIVVPDYYQWVTKLSNSGSPIWPSGYPLPGANDISGTAIDHNGNIWFLNLGTENTATTDINPNTGALFEMSPTGTILSPTGGFPCGNLNYPYSLAIDGDGNPWVANSGSNQIGSCSLNFYGGGTPAPAVVTSGSNGSTLNTPYGIAIDSSGDIWVPNYIGNSASNYIANSVTEFIGLAAPVATPIAFGVATPAYFAYRP